MNGKGLYPHVCLIKCHESYGNTGKRKILLSIQGGNKKLVCTSQGFSYILDTMCTATHELFQVPISKVFEVVSNDYHAVLMHL